MSQYFNIPHYSNTVQGLNTMRAIFPRWTSPMRSAEQAPPSEPSTEQVQYGLGSRCLLEGSTEDSDEEHDQYSLGSRCLLDGSEEDSGGDVTYSPGPIMPPKPSIQIPQPEHISGFKRIPHGHIPRHKLPTRPLGRWEDSQCERTLAFRWNLDIRNKDGVLSPSVKDAIRHSLCHPRNDSRYTLVDALTEETLGELHEIFSKSKASEIRRSFELRGIPREKQLEWAEDFDRQL